VELTQVRLLVSDFTACFRFYRDVLGLSPEPAEERGPYAKFSLPTGRAALALQTREHFEKELPDLVAGSADRALIVLKVDDVDALVLATRTRGAEIVREPADAWGRLRAAYLRDPEGNLIELQQWLVPAK
jgi:catechol 2,3-dioxygenase-like lactoylglutathione lyase family enzyme